MSGKKTSPAIKAAMKSAWLDFASTYDLQQIETDPTQHAKKLRLIFEHGFLACAEGPKHKSQEEQ